MTNISSQTRGFLHYCTVSVSGDANTSYSTAIAAVVNIRYYSMIEAELEINEDHGS